MFQIALRLIRRAPASGRQRRFSLLWTILALVALLITWQVAFAQAPKPNPLQPPSGTDINANGPAASIHGDPLRGRNLFAQNCTTCHGDRGTDGATNPGSNDGSVPLLNPIDPGFLEDAKNAPDVASAFAKGIDLFIQHGSRPAGDDPNLSMLPFGDHKLLDQQQIADVEAYVMQLNGIYWGDRYYPPAEVQMRATRSGRDVTYTITLVNHGNAPLGDITLRDTLPPGLIPYKSAIMGFDQRADLTDPMDEGNNGEITFTTVQFVGTPNVPAGGTLGPFVIVARVTDARKPIGPNVAQLLFSFTTFDGTTSMASAVSDPVVPPLPRGATPTPTPTGTRAATPTPRPTGTGTATTPTPGK